jgi:hypothetical protein
VIAIVETERSLENQRTVRLPRPATRHHREARALTPSSRLCIDTGAATTGWRVIYAIFVIGTYFKGEISSDLYAYTVSMATVGVGGFIASGFIFYRVSLKPMGFVRLAEAVFRTYGWPNVQNIHLRTTSREHHGTNTLSNYGRNYFRY